MRMLRRISRKGGPAHRATREQCMQRISWTGHPRDDAARWSGGTTRGVLGEGVGAPDEVLEADLSGRSEVQVLSDIEVVSDIEILNDLRESEVEAWSSEIPTEVLDDGGDRVVVRAPLELHEIQPHVQRELAGLDVAVIANRSRVYRLVKRVLDLVIAVPVLIVAAPVIGVLALAIRLESRGPAVFRQQRVGLDGRVFTFYKFRTMYVDAKERFPELYDYSFDSSELSSRYYKQANDPRNTRLGALIRKTTLDELPNLFNVIKGDTSIIGPRPELPEMIQHYQPSELVKFTVKPGLTCLAACTGRNTLTIDEQIRADVDYVIGQSFRLDLWILKETVLMILKAIGAE